MRITMIATASIALASCATIQDTLSPAKTSDESAARSQLALEREKQRQFERCMNLTLGKFKDFQSPEARIRATEACKDKTSP